MSGHVWIVVVIVVVAAVLIRGVMQLSGGSMAVLRATVGRNRRRERDMVQIARYWRRSTNAGAGIDDRTWTDLDMDAVFAALDYAESGVGQQLLYARLRRRGGDPGGVRALDVATTRIDADDVLRPRLSAALRAIDDSRSLTLPALFEEELAPRPQLWWVFPLLTVAAIACMRRTTSVNRSSGTRCCSTT